MAPRGPKPTPTAIKAAEGNPGHRPLNENEPKADIICPDPPTNLNAVGAEKWRELAPKLSKSGVLTGLDTDLLLIFCQLHQDEVALLEELKASDLVLTGEKGGKYANPAWSMLQAIRSMKMKIMAEFGMTPSGRTRINVAQPKNGPEKKLPKYREPTK